MLNGPFSLPICLYANAMDFRAGQRCGHCASYWLEGNILPVRYHVMSYFCGASETFNINFLLAISVLNSATLDYN